MNRSPVSIGGELPFSQRFFLEFFFAKEKASRRLATCCQRAMSVRSLFREEKFQEKPLGPDPGGGLPYETDGDARRLT